MSTFFNAIGSAAKSVCASTLRFSGAKLAVAAAGGLMLVGTSAAQAHHREHGSVDVVVAPEVRCDRPEPVCAEQERVWVPAVYRTVCDHVWHEAVYRTCCDRALVPAVFEVREVHRREGCREVCIRERVLVCPAHYEERQRQELVTGGCFEDVQRQELVCDGHWEVRDRVVVVEHFRPVVEVLPRFDWRIRR